MGRRALFFCIALLFFLVGANTAFAQGAKGSISGQVVAKGNNEPLDFATVAVFKSQDSSLVTGTTTQNGGRFTINVGKGTYYAEIAFVGYKPTFYNDIVVAPGQQVNLGTIALGDDTEVLEAVEVTAKRTQVVVELDKRVYNVGSDLTNLGGSAADVLGNLPSVEVDVEGNVSLRGSQNVRILINGKPSGLVGIGSNDALRLLQSTNIERVEVITNPSARYDAEGDVGIINIVLKKNQSAGVNGAFTATVGYPENHGLSFNLNYRKNWINFFTNVGVDYRNSPGGGFTNQRFTETLPNGQDTTFAYESTNDRMRGGLSSFTQFGVDMFLNDYNQLTVSGLYRFGDGTNTTDLIYNDLDQNGGLVSRTTRNQVEEEDDTTIELDINYRKTYEQEGREWTVNFQYQLADDTENADIVETRPTEVVNQRIGNIEDLENYLFQTDYIHPWGTKGKFETGFRGTRRIINNDYLVEEEDAETGLFEPFGNFDNSFVYDERIYAAYAMIGDQYERFGWQVGVRGEYTDILAQSAEASVESSDQEYFNLFPSASFSYKMKEVGTLQFSYSRRLTRPRFRLLLPFSNFSDARNFRAGNPNLVPEYTNSFEVGLLKDWDKASLLSSVYIRNTTGKIERIVSPDSVNFTTRIPVNLATEDALGIEFTFSYDPAPWWSLSSNFNFFRSVTEGQFGDQNLFAEALAWNTRISSKTNLWDWADFQATVNYRAPQNTTQGRRLAFYFIDLAFSKDFLKNNATVTLSVRDLLNSRVWRSEVDSPNFASESEFQWRQRQFLLNISYRLNQKKKRGRPEGGYSGGGGDF